jgi:hypothetical protein
MPAARQVHCELTGSAMINSCAPTCLQASRTSAQLTGCMAAHATLSSTVVLQCGKGSRRVSTIHSRNNNSQLPTHASLIALDHLKRPAALTDAMPMQALAACWLSFNHEKLAHTQPWPPG